MFGLTCTSCRQEILLFDEKQHGWNALVCGMIPADEVTIDYTEQCAKCGGEDFRVTVWTEACNREEFVEDVPAGLTEADWVNAYGWLTCAHCGHKEYNWADVETA